MEDVIINKVTQSSLITFNLEDLYDRHERAVFDMHQCLFQGLILREKDFRNFIAEFDWEQYRDKNISAPPQKWKMPCSCRHSVK